MRITQVTSLNTSLFTTTLSILVKKVLFRTLLHKLLCINSLHGHLQEPISAPDTCECVIIPEIFCWEVKLFLLSTYTKSRLFHNYKMHLVALLGYKMTVFPFSFPFSILQLVKSVPFHLKPENGTPFWRTLPV